MPGYNPATVYPFAVAASNVTAQIWVIVVAQKYSFTLRLVSAFMIEALVLVSLPFLANIGGAVGYWSVFAVLFFFGLITGIILASMFSLAGGLPSKYMAIMILGQGISGFSSSLLRALTLIIWPIGKSELNNNEFISTIALFLFAAVLLIICALLQFKLRKNEFAVYHLW